jgi:hypothetical protein
MMVSHEREDSSVSIKEKVTAKAIEALAPNPERPNNKRRLQEASVFHRICLWYHTQSTAKAELKKAWAEAVANKFVKDDEDLRSEYSGKGECIVSETGYYSLLVKVSDAPTPFNLDLFLDTISKKYKLDRVELAQIADGSTVRGTPALTKRVVEVA